MVNGLSMSLKEFKSLPQPMKMVCLYENQCKTLFAIKSYRLHQKIQYPWMTVLTGAVIFIIKHAVSN